MSATFVFTGDPRQGTTRVHQSPDNKESVTVFGITFNRGEEVSVSDPYVCGKLSRNDHFTEVVGESPKPKRARKVAVKSSGE